jgi:hypothetical protein
LTVPEGVTVIPDRLCYGCRSLAYVNLHDGIEAIGKGAFGGCRTLTDITLPPSITRIEYEAFSDCRRLTDINIHENIEHIADYAFKGCVSLASVTLPDSVTHIGKRDAFPPTTIIYAAYGSFAEHYAKRYYFPFEPVYPSGYTFDEPPKTNREIILHTLQKIKATQGEAAFKNPRVFKGLISDFLPGGGKHTGYKNILYTALEVLDIYEALKKAKQTDDVIINNRMVSALVDLGYQEGLARDVVKGFETITAE